MACKTDGARRALGEALGVGGWRELVAVAPPFAGLALLDLVDAACAALATPPSGTPRRCADALMALMAPSASDGDEDVARRAERRAPSDAPEKEAEAAGDVAPRRARLSPGAFALRLVSELIAAAGAWEDAVAQHAERWRFTLALSRSLLAAAVAFALGWRLAARPLLRALHGARDAREAAPRRDRGGGSVGEMRRRVERMRAEAAAEAERAREASAARAVTEPPPPAAVRAPVDVGDLDDSSAEGHAVIRARGDEGGDR